MLTAAIIYRHGPNGQLVPLPGQPPPGRYVPIPARYARSDQSGLHMDVQRGENRLYVPVTVG